MELTATLRSTRLAGLNAAGETMNVYNGRSQLSITGIALETEPAAVRIGKTVFVPCADLNLRAHLDTEWETGKPASDVMAAQAALLRENNARVVATQ